ncbi:MAG: AAA family ATPase [Prevotellaceae bacterium]|nr:AAA family ATPase [Prevotellaceae bacterium]
MGTYINRGNSEFRDIVARCRRFGKSMAARMLCAYYDKSCDSRELFRGLKADIELKFNNSVDTAIDQIKRKEYPAKIAEYSGNILLVGINYDRETKKHTCRIEKGITSANNPNVFSFAVEG